MLNGKRLMAGIGARDSAETWHDRWAARQWGEASVRWLRGCQGVRGFLLATAFLALGLLAGLVAGRLTASTAAHREGACIALQMAAALGYLDDRQQRMLMRSLATAINPDVDLFPGGHRAMRQACDAIAARS